MAEDLIQNYIDRAAFAADTKFAIEQLALLEAEYTKLKDFRVNLNSALGTKDIVANVGAATTQVKGLTTAIAEQTQVIGANARAMKAEILSLEQNIALRGRLKNTLESVKKDDKENLDLLRQGVITQQEYRKRLVESALQQEKLKTQISGVNKELKAQIALQNTPANTIARAQAENKQLTAIRNVTPTNDTERIAQLNAQIDRNNDLIDLNSDKLGKQKINIGNYQGAANSIIDAYKQQATGLQSLNTQYTSLGSKIENQKGIVSALAQSGGTSTIQYKAAATELNNLSKEYTALTPKVENARTVVEGFRRVAEVSAQDYSTLAARQSALKEETIKLGLENGKNSIVFKEVSKVVGQSGDTIAGVKGSFDKATEGANNLGTGVKKSFGFLRTLANIIPGIGISGLLLLAVDPLIELYKYITKDSEALKDLKKNQENLNSVYQEADKDAGKQISTLKILYEETQNTAESTKNRTKAAIELQKTFPETFKGFSTESILLGEASAGYDKLTQSILKTALAKAAKNKIDELESQRLDIEFNKAKIKGTTDAEAARVRERNLGGSGGSGSSLTGGGGGGNDVIITVASQRAVIEERRNKALTEQERLLSSIQSQEKFLIDFVGSNNLVDTIIGDDKKSKAKKEAGEKSIADLQKELNTEFDIYKINQARLIDLYKEEADDQKLPLAKRLDALNSFFIESRKLIGEQEEFDKQAKQREAQREIDNLNKDKKGKSAPQISRINENIAVIESNLQQELLLIEARGNDERIKSGKAFGEARASIVKSNGDKIAKIIEDTFKDLNAGTDKEFSTVNLENEKNKYLELQKLDKDFISGKIKSSAEYEKQKSEIENRYTAAGLQAEINAEEEKRAIAISFGKDTTDIDAKILQLKLKQLGIEVDATKKAADAKLKIEEELAQKKRDLLKAGTDLFIAIVQGQNDREKNRIADAQTEVDKNKERQLAANDALVQSEEKKAANIAIINARAQSQKEALDRRQKQIDYNKAVFDRAITIAEIVANTAKAVVKDLAGNKLLIPLDIAIGAVQLATVLAKPIPRFKTGKNNDYEGPAIVGDGGVAEYIERADGSLERTPAKDTLTYLGKSDIVYPDFMSMMLSRAMPALPSAKQNKNADYKSDLIHAELQKLNQGMSIVANKRENHLSAKDGALVSLWKHGANQTKYFEENTNW